MRKLSIAAASGIICGVSLGLLGIPQLKATVVTVIAGVASFSGFGTRWIQRLAIALAAFAIGVWLEVLPPLDRWRALVFSFFPPS